MAADWKPDAGFTPLFNGKDLTGWYFRAKVPAGVAAPGAILQDHAGKTDASDSGRYFAKDGVFSVSFPNDADKRTGQIYTIAEFPGNFILKLEFRASANADSGIFLRKPQLQCRDYPVAGPYTALKAYKARDWNRITVEVKNGVARCTCNGEVIEEALPLPMTGPIGLEGDRGTMEYRHIQIKKLP